MGAPDPVGAGLPGRRRLLVIGAIGLLTLGLVLPVVPVRVSGGPVCVVPAEVSDPSLAEDGSAAGAGAGADPDRCFQLTTWQWVSVLQLLRG